MSLTLKVEAKSGEIMLYALPSDQIRYNALKVGSPTECEAFSQNRDSRVKMYQICISSGPITTVTVIDVSVWSRADE